MSDKQAAAMKKLHEQNQKRYENKRLEKEKRVQEMKNTNGLARTQKELVKAETIAKCVTTQILQIAEYLEGVGMKSPAACVYHQIALDVADKISDIETILIQAR